jgi:hypothetical protein
VCKHGCNLLRACLKDLDVHDAGYVCLLIEFTLCSRTCRAWTIQKACSLFPSMCGTQLTRVHTAEFVITVIQFAKIFRAWHLQPQLLSQIADTPISRLHFRASQILGLGCATHAKCLASLGLPFPFKGFLR